MRNAKRCLCILFLSLLYMYVAVKATLPVPLLALAGLLVPLGPKTNTNYLLPGQSL